MTDYKTLYDAIVNLNIPIEKQGKFANDKDLWFEYAHFPYIGKGNQSDAVDINTPLTFEAKTDNTKIYFLAYNAEEQTRTIEVSTDNGETWTEFTAETYNEGNNTSIATLNIGEKILVRGDNPNGLGYYDYDNADDYVSAGAFWVNGQAYVYGNIMSLLSKDDFASMKSVPEYAFSSQFPDANGEWLNSDSLLSHPSKTLLLPATTLANGCYSNMFYDCASLTTAPELPATTLAQNCYFCMFSDCTSLTAAPELPATTLADKCYANMFYHCSSLTTVPELPATTLTENCYANMFRRCDSIIIAPELPATALTDSCYYSMFSDCTSLTVAPELPATTLVRNCYYQMFWNCTSLNYIKALFTTTPSGTYTFHWVTDISATGTFVKNAEATWDVTGDNGIPTGWTVETA